VIGEETTRETAGEGSREKKEIIVDPCFCLLLLISSYSCNRQVTDIRTERQRQAGRPTERQTTGEIRLQARTEKETGGWWGSTTKCKKSD
jgi:hypothetical protein